MKKQFFWLVMGATALTGCTSTDVVEESDQSNAIGFENVIKKPVRSVIEGDLNNGNFDQFSVYAYYVKNVEGAQPVPVFGKEAQDGQAGVLKEGVMVNKVGNAWTYSPERYWMPDATYYFYAYSCADIELASDKGKPEMALTGVDATARNLRIKDFICDADHQHDLIADAAEGIVGANSGNGKVKFTFKHALCKVSAQIVNDLPVGYEVFVSNVSIGNFIDQGNLSIYDNTLAWSDVKRSSLEKKIALNIVGDNKATSTLAGDGALKVNLAPVFFLPVAYDNANLKLYFTIQVRYGNDVVLEERNLIGSWQPTWETGKAYNYIVHITGNTAQLEPIVFEATQDITDVSDPTGWNGEVNTDMNFTMQ